MKICYFGNYQPDFGRNKIYVAGLAQAGHQVVQCRDDSPGWFKFFRLWQKHNKIKGNYDAMVVGYPAQLATPLAKIISKRPIIADALGSLYDAEVNSHQPGFFKKIKSWLLDWLMVIFADIVLLESEAQKKYFSEKFGREKKYRVVYTGAEDSFFNFSRPETTDKSGDYFLVLFRGKLTPESGILDILRAAKLLAAKTDIKFQIIGRGYLLAEAEKFIKEEQLTNVELISRFLPLDELAEKVSQADLMLGQLADNPRLNRTIPHKAFEALAVGVPYLTGNAPAIKEIITDGTNGFLVPLSDPKALAEKIEQLAGQPDKLTAVSIEAKKTFAGHFLPKVLAGQIVRLVLEYRGGKS